MEAEGLKERGSLARRSGLPQAAAADPGIAQLKQSVRGGEEAEPGAVEGVIARLAQSSMPSNHYHRLGVLTFHV